MPQRHNGHQRHEYECALTQHAGGYDTSVRTTRREILRRVGALGLGVPVGAAILAACAPASSDSLHVRACTHPGACQVKGNRRHRPGADVARSHRRRDRVHRPLPARQPVRGSRSPRWLGQDHRLAGQVLGCQSRRHDVHVQARKRAPNGTMGRRSARRTSNSPGNARATRARARSIHTATTGRLCEASTSSTTRRSKSR